jgi:4-amino-4-deoxy-L-arabinose transferase-like glycosyltransferase
MVRIRGLKKDILYLSLLLILGYFFFLWRLGSPALFDLDEGGYAEIAREILVLNDWIIPHFNFVRLLDKPPLLYWLTALSYKLFGISEFTSRLPVAASTIGCMLLCYLIGTKLSSKEAGLFSALIFATSAGVLILGAGRQLMPDMPFTFFITAIFALLILGSTDPANKRRYYLLAWCAMALAVMTKGLIGMIFPFLAIMGFIVVSRESNLLKDLQLIKGSLLFLGLVLPWHLLVELKTPGFMKFYLFDVHLARFFHQGSLAADDTTSLSLLTFLAVTALWFSPWVAFLPIAILQRLPITQSQPDQDDKASLWLWLWAGAVIGFFSVSFYRMDNYGLPALPALSLILGQFWAELGTKEEPSLIRWGMEGSSMFLGLISIIGMTVAIFGFTHALPPYLPRISKYFKEIVFDDKVARLSLGDNLPSLFIIGGGTIIIGAISIIITSFAHRFYLTFVIIILTMIPIYYCSHQALAFFERYLSSKYLAEIINKRESKIAEEIMIVKEGRYEDIASLGFYTGRKIYLLRGRRDDLLFGSYYSDGAKIFLNDKQFAHLWTTSPSIYLITEGAINEQKSERDNYAKLRLYPLSQSWRFNLYTNHE